MRYLSTTVLTLALTIGTSSLAAAQEWSEDFNNGIPPTWTIEDYEPFGSWFTWHTNDWWGEPNYSSGDGSRAAHADSDLAGTGEFDIALLTPAFVVPDNAGLEFHANFQNWSSDRAEVDITLDGGWSWTNLLSWQENHGGFRALPGEYVSLDLSEYAGYTAQIRFHYYDPAGAWDYYWQIDDVSVTECGGFTLCDSNCDGVVNGFDIDAFVLALQSADDYAAAYPDCNHLCNNDINGDGVVNGFDIDSFVDCLIE
ncbi:MAG: choice-of-anchor J domain-containing protein [Planctomycetes bacterium]|nr:choice-of-anchor J domain-containing protein [Planctomycetota bacterium]